MFNTDSKCFYRSIFLANVYLYQQLLINEHTPSEEQNDIFYRWRLPLTSTNKSWVSQMINMLLKSPTWSFVLNSKQGKTDLLVISDNVGPSVCTACVVLMVFILYFRNSSEGSCYIKISSAWHHRPTVQSCFWSLNTAFGSSAASAALNCQREIKGQNTSVQTPVRQIKHSWFPLEKSWSVHVQAYKT